MENSVYRVLVLLALFLILSADYSNVLSQVFSAMGWTAALSGGRSSVPRTAAVKVPEEAAHASATTAPGKEDIPSAGKNRNKFDDISEDDLTEDNSINLDREAKAKLFSTAKSQIVATLQNSCLPKLICELNASSNRDRLGESEKSLLALIRDSSIGTTAEVTSKYHFAAHMGQLIADVDGAGCHVFYPSCPFPGSMVLNMVKKVRKW